jgi:anti-sigma factor RsiW
MSPETLRALLVDRELGELAPDVAELVDAYLEAVPAARAEADAMARTVNTARETVRRFPDLAPTSEPVAEPQVVPIVYWLAPWLARAAALVAVAALAGWLGYRTGHTAGPSGPVQAGGATATRVVDSRFKGLWTQYQVAYDSRRGTFIVATQQ